MSEWDIQLYVKSKDLLIKIHSLFHMFVPTEPALIYEKWKKIVIWCAYMDHPSRFWIDKIKNCVDPPMCTSWGITFESYGYWQVTAIQSCQSFLFVVSLVLAFFKRGQVFCVQCKVNTKIWRSSMAQINKNLKQTKTCFHRYLLYLILHLTCGADAVDDKGPQSHLQSE